MHNMRTLHSLYLMRWAFSNLVSSLWGVQHLLYRWLLIASNVEHPFRRPYCFSGFEISTSFAVFHSSGICPSVGPLLARCTNSCGLYSVTNYITSALRSININMTTAPDQMWPLYIIMILNPDFFHDHFDDHHSSSFQNNPPLSFTADWYPFWSIDQGWRLGKDGLMCCSLWTCKKCKCQKRFKQ